MATANYLNYYPALGQIHLQLDRVSLVPGSNGSQLDTHMTVTNPSDYSGFRLGEADLSIYFYVKDTNITLFSPYALNVIQPIGGALGPRSSVAPDVVMQLNPENLQAFSNFTRTYAGRVIASVTLTLEIITFLVPITGRLPYEAAADLPLLSS